jgi:hypothetical protein
VRQIERVLTRRAFQRGETYVGSRGIRGPRFRVDLRKTGCLNRLQSIALAGGLADNNNNTADALD